MQLKASVWKPSKSVVEIADEFELRGHFRSSRLIYFLYVFDSLANNFRRPNMTLLDIQLTYLHALNVIFLPWMQLTATGCETT